MHITALEPQMNSKLVLVNRWARERCDWVGGAICAQVWVVWRCFLPGCFIHKRIYNVKQLVQLLVWYFNASTGNDHWKKLRHELKATELQCSKITSQKKSIYSVYQALLLVLLKKRKQITNYVEKNIMFGAFGSIPSYTFYMSTQNG